jgi:hypothetical protein
MNSKIWLGLVVLVIVAGGGFYLWQQQGTQSARENQTFVLKESAQSGYFSRDGKVYYGGIGGSDNPNALLVSEADILSFRIIESELQASQWGKDKNHVYLKNIVITGADPATFSVFLINETGPLGGEYGRDRNGFYDEQGNRITDSQKAAQLEAKFQQTALPQ